jgi:hypothetical protein
MSLSSSTSSLVSEVGRHTQVFRRLILAENLLVKTLTDDRKLPDSDFPPGSLWTLEDPISQVTCDEHLHSAFLSMY